MKAKKFTASSSSSSLFVLLFLIFGANGIITAQKKKPITIKTVVAAAPQIESFAAPANLSPELQRRWETFDFAWKTIKTNYFDQTFSGLDWVKIRQEYEPRVLKTATDAQLHDILTEMINRLERSHFAVIPPEVFQAIERAKIEAKEKEKQIAAKDSDAQDEETPDEDFEFDDFLDARFGVGVELQLIDDRFIITRVEKNSTAERANLKTGYAIEKINGVSLVELLRKLEVYYSKIRNVKKYLPAEVVNYMLNGEKNSTVAITFSSGGVEPAKTVQVERERLKGEVISIGKNFPEQFLRFESASLNDEVGYIKFNVFAIPVIEKFCAALTDLKDKKAIVVDLRGNTGGILGSMVALGGMLTGDSINLGTSIYKIGSENFIAASKAKNFKGKLVFLVDNHTVSAAEIFTAALQENKRAVVVGERTAGEALPSVSVALPTGAVLLYPIANYKTRNGNFLEGKGVEPNVVAALDRKSLLEGKDNQLEAALQAIKDDKAFAKMLEEKNAAAASGLKTVTGSGSALSSLPPPPPAAPKPKGRVLGEVNITAPPPPREPLAKRDEKAVQVVADFINQIGGEAALGKINSYTARGRNEVSTRGVKSDLAISFYRDKSDRYAEIMRSDAAGEVREVTNGKASWIQSDYGRTMDFPAEINFIEMEIFAPIFTLAKRDAFKSMTYSGVFDRLGRKTHIIEAKTADFHTVALAFDVETKMLVSYVGGGLGVSYGDYRAVESVKLPFAVEREYLMKIAVEEVNLNPAIDAAIFEKKQYCYDKAN